jgi:hypothetical protein
MNRYLLFLILMFSSAPGVTLQEVYQTAGPGQGYDKLVALEAGKVYTGGITVFDEKAVIHGNGAAIDLGGGSITIANDLVIDTRLDIDHCVLTNGAIALDYSNSANGHITNCTFYLNQIGVQILYCTDTLSSILNCIFLENSEYAVLCMQYYYPAISHNCCYNNGGDYFEGCG